MTKTFNIKTYICIFLPNPKNITYENTNWNAPASLQYTTECNKQDRENRTWELCISVLTVSRVKKGVLKYIHYEVCKRKTIKELWENYPKTYWKIIICTVYEKELCKYASTEYEEYTVLEVFYLASDF